MDHFEIASIISNLIVSVKDNSEIRGINAESERLHQDFQKVSAQRAIDLIRFLLDHLPEEDMKIIESLQLNQHPRF